MKGKISLEDLVEQFLDQCRSGNVPDIQDFAGAHPEFASELLALLPLVMEMEDWSVEKKQGIMPPVHDFPDLEGDDYRLIRRLGSGGMGVVFEALQLSLNRKVALKLLSPLLLQDAAQRSLFEHEAHVIARLHHPNIVRIFSAACRPGCCYYAMELIEGKSLDGCEFSNPYEIARIGLQAARAIAYAHHCGILHRDAGRVITAVFKLGQTVQQNRCSLCCTGKAYDSAHNRYPPLCSCSIRPSHFNGQK